MRIYEQPIKLIRQFLTMTGKATAPDVSKSDEARIYYDSAADAVKVSTNGGAYSALATSNATYNPEQAAVANIGATTNLVGVNGTGNNAAPLVETESRLDVIEAKVDAVLAKLRLANIIADA